MREKRKARSNKDPTKRTTTRIERRNEDGKLLVTTGKRLKGGTEATDLTRNLLMRG